LGAHKFEYALVLHDGDWSKGGVLAEATRFSSPPVTVTPSGRAVAPGATALVEVTPPSVVLTAVHPAETGRGIMVRVVNASPTAQEATLQPGFAARSALAVDPLEREVEKPKLQLDNNGAARVALGPWQIATVLFRS
jgi:alpha-mannosidase